MTRVASIGECMIELRQTTDGKLIRGYGGDTLNTAVYLARLGTPVDYVTALGDDPLSDEMIAGWAAEQVGTGLVARLPGKLPGLYMIQTDAAGERRFYHWRDSSAVRSLLSLPQTDEILGALAGYDLVYLSAITLSLYDEAGRRRLLAALARARENAVRVAFDTNFRARGWPDLEIARQVFQDAFGVADIVLASTEDMSALYPGESGEQLLTARSRRGEVVMKLAEPACIVRSAGRVATGQGRSGSRHRRRHHRRRRQFCRGLSCGAACAAPIRSRRRGPGIGWPEPWCAIPARSFPSTRCRTIYCRDRQRRARHRHEHDIDGRRIHRTAPRGAGHSGADHRAGRGRRAAGPCAGGGRRARAGDDLAHAGGGRRRQGDDRAGAGSHRRHRHGAERARIWRAPNRWGPVSQSAPAPRRNCSMRRRRAICRSCRGSRRLRN